MLSGYPPFSGEHEKEIFYAIKHSKLEFDGIIFFIFLSRGGLGVCFQRGNLVSHQNAEQGS